MPLVVIGVERARDGELAVAARLVATFIEEEWRGIMSTRIEILDTLAASQAQVMAFFQGLSPQDLERPATASEVPGAAPWRAKDHFAHLVQNERNIQQLLRRALAGEPRDVILRSQYPEGMPLPGILGDWDALTPEEQERLGLAVAQLNQTYRDGTMTTRWRCW